MVIGDGFGDVLLRKRRIILIVSLARIPFCYFIYIYIIKRFNLSISFDTLEKRV